MAADDTGMVSILNGLDLVNPPDGWGQFPSWRMRVSANGTTWASAAVELRTIESRLLNGAATAIDRYDNSTVVLFIRIEGTDSEQLAQGKAALTTALRTPKLGSFIFVHPDGASLATVWDVIVADPQLQFAGSDQDDVELAKWCRATYQVTLTCHPFPRAAVKTVVPALPQPDPAPPTVIDDGSSTDGWSATGGTLATDGSSVTVTTTITTGGNHSISQTLTRAFSPAVETSTTPYVTLTGAATGFDVITEITFTLDGQPVTPISYSLSATSYTAVLHVADTVDEVGVHVDGKVARAFTWTGTVNARLGVEEITRSNTAAQSDGRQQSRIAPIYGTMPTEASIIIKATAGALGRQTLAYTAPPQPSGFTPDLSRYRSDDITQTPSTDCVSGAETSIPVYTDLSTEGIVYTIPTGDPQPGTYQLYARIKMPDDWDGSDATIYVQRGQTPPNIFEDFVPHPIRLFDPNNSTDWQIVALNPIELPLLRIPTGTVGTSSGQLQLAASIEGILLDEAWLCNMDIGQVSLIDTSMRSATADQLTQIRIDAANLDDLAGENTLIESYWGGLTNDDNALFYVGQWVDSWSQHIFDPAAGAGTILVFVATMDEPAEVSLEYYERYADMVASSPAHTSDDQTVSDDEGVAA